MSKNISLFIIIALGIVGFWWLGQRTQNDIIPLHTLGGDLVKTASTSKIVELKDGDTYDMEVGYVQREIEGKRSIMEAYNGSVPGPTIKVAQNATIRLNLTNNTEEPTMLHSHGLRLDNTFDGTHFTQEPIEPGETFTYELSFPDVGMYWYHPHIREDKHQAMGQFGNFWVVPEDDSYWSEVNREIPLILSDLLVNDSGLVPFGDETTHTLMGRFGNIMLVNGMTDYALDVKQGEVIRFYITNAASARPFKLAIPNVAMKLVGGDNGVYEKEVIVDSVTIAPSERYIIDAYFEEPGEYTMKHDGPDIDYDLGTVTVDNERIETSYEAQFHKLRTQEIFEEWREFMDAPVQKNLSLTVDMSEMGHAGHTGASLSQPIEWEDKLPHMNAMSDVHNVAWQFIDTDTGNINETIDWTFARGEMVKIRIENDGSSDHPMQHPIHFHGQRFLVLKENDTPNDNLVWKDTVLVPSNKTVEVLLEVTNPGIWMVHCHISEHLEAGMMFTFEVQ